MNIEFLDEELVKVIDTFFPNLDWNGQDSSASAKMPLNSYGTIDYELMQSIGNCLKAIEHEEFCLTIRPSKNELILYYID